MLYRKLAAVVFCRPSRAQHRHLQESESDCEGCTVSVGNQSLTFTTCQRLITETSDAQLLWTLQHDGVRTAAHLLEVACSCAHRMAHMQATDITAIRAALACHDGGWCAFGLPNPETGHSASASAVLLQECSGCSSGKCLAWFHRHTVCTAHAA